MDRLEIVWGNLSGGLFLPIATAFRGALSEIRPHRADFGGPVRLIVQKLEDVEEQTKD